MHRTSTAQNNGRAVRVSFGYDLTFRDVAEALGVSESTVKRRAQEHSISVGDRRSKMTDHELDEVLRQIKTEFPNAGYRRVHSQLVSRGIRVFTPRSAGSNA